MITVSLLQRVGIITAAGKIVDYDILTDKHTVMVIQGILRACNSSSDVPKNIREYITDRSAAGRSILNRFPECVILSTLRNHGSKLIDHLLLDNDQGN
jgi:hypothetical protein